MIQRFEEFTKNISLAYKFIVKIKSYEMTEYGLKGSNVTCLFFLGKHEDGLTATELCEKCSEDKAAVSKSLALLMEKEYVTREGDKKYKSKYVITPSGKKVFDEICTIINDVVEKAGEGLTDDERMNFYVSLDKIVSNLSEILSKKDSR